MSFPVWKVTVLCDGQPVETRWQTSRDLIYSDFAFCMDSGGGFTLTVEQVQADEVP